MTFAELFPNLLDQGGLIILAVISVWLLNRTWLRSSQEEKKREEKHQTEITALQELRIKDRDEMTSAYQALLIRLLNSQEETQRVFTTLNERLARALDLVEQAAIITEKKP